MSGRTAVIIGDRDERTVPDRLASVVLCLAGEDPASEDPAGEDLG